MGSHKQWSGTRERGEILGCMCTNTLSSTVRRFSTKEWGAHTPPIQIPKWLLVCVWFLETLINMEPLGGRSLPKVVLHPRTFQHFSFFMCCTGYLLHLHHFRYFLPQHSILVTLARGYPGLELKTTGVFEKNRNIRRRRMIWDPQDNVNRSWPMIACVALTLHVIPRVRPRLQKWK